MLKDTTKVLLTTAYLALVLFLAWPLIAYPQMAGKLPNVLAIAFLACSILTMLVRLPTPIVIAVAALNGAAGLMFIAWIVWAVYTGPVGAPDRNLIPLVFYFTVIAPIVTARTLFASIRKA
jgi:ABC-type transport system involved in cytochrome c biogenesis permease subunit